MTTTLLVFIAVLGLGVYLILKPKSTNYDQDWYDKMNDL